MEQAQAAALPRRHTARVGWAAHGSTFVLVHSPLVGPTSWRPVARALERRGRIVVVPSLGVADAAEPQWHHVRDAVRIILVGHSGAGLLLPVIADALDNDVAALIFVDSSL